MIGSAVVSWSNTWCQSISSSSSTKPCMLLSVNILVFILSTCLYLVLGPQILPYDQIFLRQEYHCLIWSAGLVICNTCGQ